MGVYLMLIIFYLKRVGGNLLSLSLYIWYTSESKLVNESVGVFSPHLSSVSLL